MTQRNMDITPESKNYEDVGHIPVMLNEVIDYLRPKPGQIFVDGTLGLGGHAKKILKLIGQDGRMIGIDRDQQALAKAQENLKNHIGQCHFVHENFCHMDKVLSSMNIDQVDGILLDLGVSSIQLDDPHRGFGYRQDGPLDMRMDQDNQVSAFSVINAYSENEIAEILKEFGQERWHRRIARRIVYERTKGPITTTKELSNIILRAMPRYAKREKIHPATRTFQAIRIVVNRELESVEEMLKKLPELLKTGGRIGVIAFHSLEDRIVKQSFRELSRAGKIDLIVKKPIRPGEEEIEGNPRARSARLRIAERI